MNLEGIQITNQFTKGDLIVQNDNGDKICIHLSPIQIKTAKAILGIEIVQLENREFDVFMLDDSELF